MEKRIARVDGKIFCEACGDLVELSKYRMHLRYAHKEAAPKTKKEFICQLCFKQFTSKYNLDYHLAHHYNLKNFVCDQCPNAYNTQADLNQHKRTHDKGKFAYRCSECGELFDQQSKFNTHMKSHMKFNGSKKCSVCHKILSSQFHLNEHMLVHSNERKVFKCEQCGKEFMKRESLKRHFDVHHLGLKKYSCIICGKAFGNPNDRRKHELIHEKGRNATYCTYCKKYFEDIKLHDDTTHHDFPFTCSICHRKFPSERDISRHKLIKHVNENYICDLCGSGFADLYHLRCHIQSHIVKAQDAVKYNQEGSSKVLDCSICGKHFNYPRSVIRHILSVHEKVKDFECEICGRKFSDKGDLNKHRKKFHEERNFGKFCKICKIKIDDMKGHYDEVHGDLEHCCNICHVRFKSLSTLSYHKKLKHSKGEKELKFKCSTCGKGYFYKSLLTKHEETHEKIKPRKKVKREKILEVKQEPMEHVEAIFSYENETEDFVEIKEEPIEETHEENVDAFLISNIKDESESASDFDDENWVDDKSSESSSEEEIQPKPIDKGIFQRIIDKYPSHKDGKRLQVRCKMCCDIFKSILEYKNHFMELHTKEEEYSHECKECELTFDYRKEFLSHFRDVHEIFSCTRCKRQFASQHQLDEHRKEYHEKTDSKLICSFCGKIYATQVSFKLHVDAVHNDFRNPCDMCDKVFTFKSALYKHRQIAHLKGKTYKCSQCEFSAGTKHEIKLHVKNHHTYDRERTRNDIVCGECGMQFHNESTLKRHLFHVHDGLLLRYKQKCLFCAETLATSYKADRHMTQVHLGGKKPLRQCGYCKVKIKLFDEYKQHISSHPGVFICIICGDAHFTPESLSIHKKVHSVMGMDLRKFCCDHCGHKTFKKAQMIIHMAKHAIAPELFPGPKTRKKINRSCTFLNLHEPFCSFLPLFIPF